MCESHWRHMEQKVLIRSPGLRTKKKDHVTPPCHLFETASSYSVLATKVSCAIQA